jgi:DNA (cytosine-5)-methyltransferase 1
MGDRESFGPVGDPPAERGRLMTPLVLSLFPGIGLLDRAFEEEGFCVVRGPDVLWGGDVKWFHPPAGKFDGVIGGPPCQAFSRLRHLVKHKGLPLKPNLIPEFERVVKESSPRWFLMENVQDAPLPYVPGYITRAKMVRDVWVGGLTSRLRRFSFGTVDGVGLWIDGEALCNPMPAAPVLASDGGRCVVGGSGKAKRSIGAAAANQRPMREILELQGLPENFLAEAPFTMSGKRLVIGNGVPLPMGRAIAKAVKLAMMTTGDQRAVARG